MNIPVIAFFNSIGGVGKTFLVYHLASMFTNLQYRVIAVDLDPQGNLTSTFVDEYRLEQILSGNGNPRTVYGAVQPLKQGAGDIAKPHIELIDDYLGLIPGDVALSTFEDDLSEAWSKCLAGDSHAPLIVSAFWRVI